MCSLGTVGAIAYNRAHGNCHERGKVGQVAKMEISKGVNVMFAMSWRSWKRTKEKVCRSWMLFYVIDLNNGSVFFFN